MLASKIRQNPEIKGIEINGVEEIGVQYADDLWLILRYDQQILDTILMEFESFRHFSGLKTNFNKTIVLRIGSIANSSEKLRTKYQLNWITGPTKILGIWIHVDRKIMLDLNYSPLLQKVRDIITMWRYRTMSPIGKVQVINSLIASLFVYKFICLPSPPDEIFTKFKEITNEFLWGKTLKIAYDKIILDTQEGGLKLLDLSAKGRMGGQGNAAINTSPIYQTLPIKNEHIWKCNTAPESFRGEDLNNMDWQVWHA